MSSPADSSSGDFIVGGPVRPDHPGYVWRAADRELVERLRAREYCHVVSSPQTGKTSLMAQAARRLRHEGFKVVALDFAEIGSRNIADDVGRWYYSFAWRVERELRIRTDLSAWWQERSGLTTMQRLRDFFLEVVLASTQETVVIFLDRAEMLGDYPEAWDIFDAVRACFDARATEPEYQRLVFVMLGDPVAERMLATRSDSPFTISTPVTLGDFTPGELRRALRGIALPAGMADRVCERIWYWTGGHPYLSQKLGRALARVEPMGVTGPALVDECATRLFLGRNAVREDAHLAFLASRLLAQTPALAERLALLGRVGKGSSVRVESGERAPRELLDLGVLIEHDGMLGLRNRIYARVFSPLWVNRKLPVRIRDMGAAAVVALVIVALPVWYTRYLPQPYMASLQSDRQDYASAREAWERMRMMPGFATEADNLFADYLVRQGEHATQLPEAQRIGQRLAELPGGKERAAGMLAGFWDRRAQVMAEHGDRDGAIIYTLQSLAQPTRERQERLAELLGGGFASLAATIRPDAPLAGLEIDPQDGLLTTLDERHEVAAWHIDSDEPRREKHLTLTAAEVRPLQRARLFPVVRHARQLDLSIRVDHERPRDLEVILRAPSGRQAVLRVADAAAGNRPGEFRFDSRRNYGLLPLLEQSIAGTWTAFFSDTTEGRAGRLLDWTLVLDGEPARAAAGSADDGVIPQPRPAAEMMSVLGPGGRRALTWPVDPEVRGDVLVWDLERGVLFARVPRPAQLLSARFVLGQSAVLLIGERDLELRDAATGRLVGRLPMLAGARSQPVISENGRYLVLDTQAGADASALTLWDLNGLRALGRVVTGTPAEVVAIDPRGRYLAIGDRERFVRVWQVQNQALTAECEHPARPIAVAFDPSGQWLVTQDVADALRIWDYSAGCRVLVARRGNGRWQAAFSPAADSVLVGNYSRGFEWLALPLGQRMGFAVQPGMSGAGSVPETVAAMPRVVPQLGLAVTYDGRRAVKLWTLPRQDGEASAVVAGDTDEIAISPGTGLVARGSAAGDVRMGAGDTLATLRQVADTEPDFIGHLSAVTALAFDHRGRLVASGSLDGTIRVWDARSGMPRNFFAAHGDGAVHDIAFFPRGEWLASASRGSVLVVDAASGEVRSRLAIQAEHPVLDVSADGAWVYIAGDRNGITRWNWRTGSANTVAEGEQPIRVIALSRDGQLLAGAANDRVVRLWQLHTGVVLHRTFTAPAPVNAVWFSADRSQLMVQSGAWVHVLDVDTAGLTARHSTPLPDADTRIGPAADGQGVLLFGTTPGALPGVTRLARSQSWASPVDVDRNSPLARTIAGRLNLTVDAMGAMRPADTPLNH